MSNIYNFKFLLPIDEGLWIHKSFSDKANASLNDKLQTLRQLSSQLSTESCSKQIDLLADYLHQINDAINNNDQNENIDSVYSKLEESVNRLQNSLSSMSDDELAQLKTAANECANLGDIVDIHMYDRDASDDLAQYKEISFHEVFHFQEALHRYMYHIDHAYKALHQLQEIIEPMTSFKYLKHALEASNNPKQLMQDYLISFHKLEDLSLPLTGALEKINTNSPDKSLYKSCTYMLESDAVDFVSESERFLKQKQSTFRQKVDPNLIEAYRAFVQEFVQKQHSVDEFVRKFVLAMRYSALNDAGAYKSTHLLFGFGSSRGSVNAVMLHDAVGSSAFDAWFASQVGCVPVHTNVKISATYDITETNVKVTITGNVDYITRTREFKGYLHGVPVKEHPAFVHYKNLLLHENDNLDPNEVDALTLEKVVDDYGIMTDHSFSPMPEFVFEYAR